MEFVRNPKCGAKMAAYEALKVRTVHQGWHWRVKILVVTIHTASCNIQTFYFLPSQCIYIFYILALNINNSLWGTNWKVICSVIISCSVRTGRSGDRILVGTTFSVSVQDRLCGPPSPLQNRYRVFPGGKVAGEMGLTPPPNSEVKERVELYLYTPSGSSWLVVRRTFTFHVIFKWLVLFLLNLIGFSYIKIKCVLFSFAYLCAPG
jgi:hypothetical protein